MQLTVIQLKTGASGSGKTFHTVKWLLDTFLRESEGRFITNLPIFIEKIAAEMNRKNPAISIEKWQDRMEVIPEDVLRTWREGESGPWDFFKGRDLTACHIAIDEVHVFIGDGAKKEIKAAWLSWLGDIRHAGATVELLTQEVGKVFPKVVKAAGVRMLLQNTETRRDPFFRIQMGDWYEVIAGFLTGKYTAWINVIEKRFVDEKWVTEITQSFTLDPYYFPFYDSFSAPQHGGTGARLFQREFQKRSKFGLAWWFVRRHLWAFSSRTFAIAVFIWWMSGGAIHAGTWIGQWAKAQGLRAQQINTAIDVAKGTSKPSSSSKPAIPGYSSSRPSRAIMFASSRPVADMSPNEKAEFLRLGLEDLREIRERERAEFAALNVQLAKAEKELEEMKKERESATGVVMILESTCVLRSGLEYRVGEKIDYGPHAGKTVRSIDSRRRVVVLDDGSILRMSIMGNSK